MLCSLRLTTSEGTAASTSRSTRSGVNRCETTRARVSFVTETDALVSGGRNTTLRLSKPGAISARRAFVSSRKTGLCPAVASGRKESRGSHSVTSRGEVICETPMKSARRGKLALVEP